MREKGQLRLNDGDMFYLLANLLPPDDQPVFWQFTFYDANTTHNHFDAGLPQGVQFIPKLAMV